MRMEQLSMEQSEGAAYVTQALYLALMGQPIVNYQPSWDWDASSMTSWYIIFNEAAKIAAAVQQGKRAPEPDVRMLYNAIAHANLYRAKAGTTVDNYGLADAFYDRNP
jgi:hypothetical protein